MDLSLLPLAAGPAALLLHVAWALDRTGREPWRNVLRYVVAGAIAAALTWFVEALEWPLVGTAFRDPSVIWPVRFLIVFLGVGLVEEGLKLACLAGAARGDRELDEPFDWVVYAVSVALGFAAIENLRVLWEGPAVGWSRAWSAVPAHALLGTLMGFRLAQAMHAPPAERSAYRALALVEPAAWHAVYDALIDQSAVMAPGPARAYLGLLWYAVLLALWGLAAGRVRTLWDGAGSPPPVLAPLTALDRLRGRDAPGPGGPSGERG